MRIFSFRVSLEGFFGALLLVSVFLIGWSFWELKNKQQNHFRVSYRPQRGSFFYTPPGGSERHTRKKIELEMGSRIRQEAGTQGEFLFDSFDFKLICSEPFILQVKKLGRESMLLDFLEGDCSGKGYLPRGIIFKRKSDGSIRDLGEKPQKEDLELSFSPIQGLSIDEKAWERELEKLRPMITRCYQSALMDSYRHWSPPLELKVRVSISSVSKEEIVLLITNQNISEEMSKCIELAVSAMKLSRFAAKGKRDLVIEFPITLD